MNNQNTWKIIFKGRKSVLLLCALAMISSTLYAIYLKQHHQLDMTYVNSYVVESVAGSKILDVKYLVVVYMSYIKRYLIIWLLGLVSFLTPLAMLGIFVNNFAYGFSIAAMYLSYGKEGLWMCAHLFVIQGVLFMVLLLKLAEGINDKNQMLGMEGSKSYGVYFFGGVIGCLGIALVELIMIL